MIVLVRPVRRDCEGMEEGKWFRIDFRELPDGIPDVIFEFKAPDLLDVRGK